MDRMGVCNAGAQFGTVNSSRLVGYTQNDWGVCVGCVEKWHEQVEYSSGYYWYRSGK